MPPIHSDDMMGFTATQKARQARNRHTSSKTLPFLDKRQDPFPNDERFEQEGRRSGAAKVLDSNELLIWFSSMRNESIPQTRIHFQRILAELDAKADPKIRFQLELDMNLPTADKVIWADDFTVQESKDPSLGGSNEPLSKRGKTYKPSTTSSYGKSRG